MHQLAKSFLEYLLPACCLLCRQASPLQLLCAACERDLPRIARCCRQCALPFAVAGTEAGSPAGGLICASCLRHAPAWDHAIAALVYEYPVDHLVRSFKFHKSLACGQLLANELVRAVQSAAAEPSGAGGMPDLLVPIPLHFLRRCKRGFNQAEILAKELHRACGIPMQNRLLRRSRHTPAQSGLDRKARQRNLRDAFRCPTVHGLHIALVDDVLTTGATLEECSRVLKQAGARQVSVWVAARVPAPAL